MKFIIGAGGGGRTVLSILERNSKNMENKRDICFLDDNKVNKIINNYEVMDSLKNHVFEKNLNDKYIISFGTTCMKIRAELFIELKSKRIQFFNAIDKSVIVDRTAIIGEGCIIAGNSVLNPNSKIGNNCFLCVNTTLDHDAQLGNNVYCSPGVNIAGAVKIGNNVFLGTNCTILPNINIGDNAIIGAGTVVIRDVKTKQKVVGNPARLI
jgi:acetyltransferase EpsM